jgi:hypothetical protein
LRQLLYSCFGRLFLAGYNGLQMTAKKSAFVETEFVKLVLARKLLILYLLCLAICLTFTFYNFQRFFLATMTVKARVPQTKSQEIDKKLRKRQILQSCLD